MRGSGLQQVSGYRADIDGLRAIAVLAVLAYHYRAPFLKFPLNGGFAGVDVFFVISGFLITQGLMQDVYAGKFSILNFYDRRIRRILPALIVMLATVLLAGKFLLLPGDYQSLTISAVVSAFGVSNFFFLKHTGYFDQAADLMPLIHTWSLAVEEQFYLVWPILLSSLTLNRIRIDLAIIVAALAIAGFGASLVYFHADPKAAFFMAPPRAWEVLIGGALVFLPPLRKPISSIAATGGVGLIIMGLVTIRETSFPGISALLPCAGAALIIWPRMDASISARLLAKLAPIGLISYSLYLWHWPVWVLYRVYINDNQPNVAEAILLAAISLLLATLSYWFVERPFRRGKWLERKTVLAGLSASTFIFCASIYIDSANGLPSRTPANLYAMRSLDVMWDWPCATEPLFANREPTCILGQRWQSTDKRFVLWGDSHASHFAPLFDVTAKRNGWSGALLTWCPAVLDDKLSAYKNDEPQYAAHCIEQRRTAIAAIASDPHIDEIFLASAWTNLVRFAINASPQLSYRIDAFRIALDRLLDELAPLHRRIIILGDIPQWRSDPLPCVLASQSNLLRRSCGARHTSIDFVEEFQAPILQAIAAEVAKYPNVSFVDTTIRMCTTSRCTDTLDNEFLYRDVTHFRRNLAERTRDDLSRLLDLDALFRAM